MFSFIIFLKQCFWRDILKGLNLMNAISPSLESALRLPFLGGWAEAAGSCPAILYRDSSALTSTFYSHWEVLLNFVRRTEFHFAQFLQ